MKNLLLVGLLFAVISSAHATVEECKEKGQLFEAIAVQRDKGQPMDAVLALLFQYGLPPQLAGSMVGMVYGNPNLLPIEFNKFILRNCLKDEWRARERAKQSR